MLWSLYVKNIALIREMLVGFSPGLTIITGETGAGKSILLGALGLVLGERSSSEMIRSGAAKATIEAIFRGALAPDVAGLLREADIEAGEELILRRDLSASGQSRCFVNDSPVPLALLRRFGEELIDLHGQHDHQKLLRTETHESFLDEFAGNGELLREYQQCRNRLHGLCGALRETESRLGVIRREREVIDFQRKELRAARLDELHEEELEREITMLEHGEELLALTGSARALLYDDEHSVIGNMKGVLHALVRLVAVDRSFESAVQDAEHVLSVVDELARLLRDGAQEIDLDQERLELLREQQMEVRRLCRKYGRPLHELQALLLELDARSAEEHEGYTRVEQLREEIVACRRLLSELAVRLSEGRMVAAAELETAIREQLAELDIPDALFAVSLTHETDPEGDVVVGEERFVAFGGGYDRVEFLISTNPGEAPRPLAKVASGGEISRVMLAMKSVLAGSVGLPVLVFDEIDTGISGKTAGTVGKRLQKLSGLHQIIAITHLPQIAALADLHLFVKKAVEDDRTVTEVRTLEGDERLHAIAALMGGNGASAASLELAAELMGRKK